MKSTRSRVSTASRSASRGVLPYANLALNAIKRYDPDHPRIGSRSESHVQMAMLSAPPCSTLKLRAYDLRGRPVRRFDPSNPRHRQIMVCPREVAMREQQRMLKAIRACQQVLAPRVICFNELAFPSIAGHPSKGFLAELVGHSIANDTLIVAGTAHNATTLYNTAYVVFPGGGSAGVEYHKQVSARHAGEFVNVPSARETPIIEDWYGLNFSLLTCLDLADFSAVAHVVRYAVHTHVLLVPAYSEKEEKLDACARETSSALPGLVALVNIASARGDSGSRLFAFGEELTKKKLANAGWLTDASSHEWEGYQCRGFKIDKSAFLALVRDYRKAHHAGGHPYFGRGTLAADV